MSIRRTGTISGVETVVIAIQHDDLATERFDGDIGREYEFIVSEINEKVIDQVIPSSLMTEKTRRIVNGTGRFVLGGPHADAGLTGRKIIVDTYGGMGRHGGGLSVVRILARSIGQRHMLHVGLRNMSSLVGWLRSARFSLLTQLEFQIL